MLGDDSQSVDQSPESERPFDVLLEEARDLAKRLPEYVRKHIPLKEFGEAKFVGQAEIYPLLLAAVEKLKEMVAAHEEAQKKAAESTDASLRIVDLRSKCANALGTITKLEKKKGNMRLDRQKREVDNEIEKVRSKIRGWEELAANLQNRSTSAPELERSKNDAEVEGFFGKMREDIQMKIEVKRLELAEAVAQEVVTYDTQPEAKPKRIKPIPARKKIEKRKETLPGFRVLSFVDYNLQNTASLQEGRMISRSHPLTNIPSSQPEIIRQFLAVSKGVPPPEIAADLEALKVQAIQYLDDIHTMSSATQLGEAYRMLTVLQNEAVKVLKEFTDAVTRIEFYLNPIGVQRFQSEKALGEYIIDLTGAKAAVLYWIESIKKISAGNPVVQINALYEVALESLSRMQRKKYANSLYVKMGHATCIVAFCKAIEDIFKNSPNLADFARKNAQMSPVHEISPLPPLNTGTNSQTGINAKLEAKMTQWKFERLEYGDPKMEVDDDPEKAALAILHAPALQIIALQEIVNFSSSALSLQDRTAAEMPEYSANSFNIVEFVLDRMDARTTASAWIKAAEFMSEGDVHVEINILSKMANQYCDTMQSLDPKEDALARACYAWGINQFCSRLHKIQKENPGIETVRQMQSTISSAIGNTLLGTSIQLGEGIPTTRSAASMPESEKAKDPIALYLKNAPASAYVTLYMHQRRGGEASQQLVMKEEPGIALLQTQRVIDELKRVEAGPDKKTNALRATSIRTCEKTIQLILAKSFNDPGEKDLNTLLIPEGMTAEEWKPWEDQLALPGVTSDLIVDSNMTIETIQKEQAIIRAGTETQWMMYRDVLIDLVQFFEKRNDKNVYEEESERLKAVVEIMFIDVIEASESSFERNMKTVNLTSRPPLVQVQIIHAVAQREFKLLQEFTTNDPEKYARYKAIIAKELQIMNENIQKIITQYGLY